MSENLLRTYVNSLLELRLNKWLLNRLNIHDKTRVGVPFSLTNAKARLIAIEWIDDVEYELGRELGKEIEAQVKRYTAAHWHDVKQKFQSADAAKEKLRSMLDSEFSHLYLKESDEKMLETVMNDRFIRHMQNGLSYGRGDDHVEAHQIASDWLTEVELEMNNLLTPGHVSRIERFVVREWPVILEQFRGNKRLALIAMNNLLYAKFNDLR